MPSLLPTPHPLTLARQMGNLSQAIEQHFDVPDPALRLPEPPALERYLFEQPLLPVALLAFIGLVLLFWLRSRDQTQRGVVVGGGLVLLAGAWFAMATLVRTPREQLGDATRELVGAVATNDQAMLAQRLDDTVKLIFFEAPTGMAKPDILRRVDELFRSGSTYALSDWRILAVQRHAQDDGRSGQVQVKVWVRAASFNFPNNSWWRLDFRKDDQGQWRATGIMPLAIQNMANPAGR